VRQSLLDEIGPRLKELEKGGYARIYRRNGKVYPSGLHMLVAEILDSAGVEYEEGKRVSRGSALVADFAVGNRLIFVEKNLSSGDRKLLARLGKTCTVLTTSAKRSDSMDTGIRLVNLSGEVERRLQTIFLDDPSFNFDYAHILPKTEKCSVMHGHTSSALVEIIGTPRDGMVVDFNEAKPVIRNAIKDLDHKLFINSKYVTSEDRTHVELSFETTHGSFELRVPKQTTVLLRGEATVENLAQELLERIAPGMPDNVEAVGVYVYEGLNKGTHLLAQIHRREAEGRRKR
jgi:6-pyruvoyltetrahydropterin/6-carboxytetrahydropterin synthase